MNDKKYTLKDIPNYKEVVLENINGEKRYMKRLLELGLITGTKIKVIKNIKNGPTIINVKGVRLILGYGLSSKIFIKKE